MECDPSEIAKIIVLNRLRKRLRNLRLKTKRRLMHVHEDENPYEKRSLLHVQAQDEIPYKKRSITHENKDENTYKKRSLYIQPIFDSRLSQGESWLVKELAMDPYYHHKYFRMNEENFDEILNYLISDLTTGITHRRPITALEKLAITLRYMASGNSQTSVAMSYRVSPSSVSKIIREVVQSICKHMGPLFLPPPTEETWIKNEVGFRDRWNYPNAVGAIDGKHIRIQASTLPGSSHYNYKNYLSLVLLAVTNPDYGFTYVDIEATGDLSDSGVLPRSTLGQQLNDGTLLLPPPKQVGDELLPHVLLGDDTLPLTPFMMTPFSDRFLTKEQKIYNYHQNRGLLVVENSFGILAARWKILHSTIIADLDFTKRIVEACVILHNFLIAKNDLNGITSDVDNHGIVTPGNWREDGQLSSLGIQDSNIDCSNSVHIREQFLNYFNNEGDVS